MGDEVRRSQLGNNNAYCQNNELSWFNWDLVQPNSGMLRFVKLLIESRLSRDMAKAEFSMSLQQWLSRAKFKWHGVKLDHPDWSERSHSIAIEVITLSGSVHMHYMINAYAEALTFELPKLSEGTAWRRWIDTSLSSPDDICIWKHAPEISGNSYNVMDRSISVLICELG